MSLRFFNVSNKAFFPALARPRTDRVKKPGSEAASAEHLEKRCFLYIRNMRINKSYTVLVKPLFRKELSERFQKLLEMACDRSISSKKHEIPLCESKKDTRCLAVLMEKSPVRKSWIRPNFLLSTIVLHYSAKLSLRSNNKAPIRDKKSCTTRRPC